MKVQNAAIFMGDNTRNERHNGVAEEKNNQKNIFAGDLSSNFDPVAHKRQQARKQALKVVGDAWAGDQKIDRSLADSRNRLKEYQEQVGEANTELRYIKEERLALRDFYGVDPDSQEEQDLQLLVKREESHRKGSDVRLTKEEYERLKEIDKEGLTDYQTRSLEMFKSGEYYADKKYEAEKGIQEENSFLKSARINQPKNRSMLKAQAAAEDIMEAASKEIVGMLYDEAKDHIDEEMEEKKEAAEEKAKKEKEEEEKLENIKEKKKEKEEFSEEIAEQTGDITEYLTKMDDTMEDAQRELKKIMEKMKLLEEDLKGAAVDATS